MSELVQRVLTAAVLVTVLLGVLFAAPGGVAIGAAALLMLLAAREWTAFLGDVQPLTRHLYLLLLAVAFIAAYWLVPEQLDLVACAVGSACLVAGRAGLDPALSDADLAIGRRTRWHLRARPGLDQPGQHPAGAGPGICVAAAGPGDNLGR